MEEKKGRVTECAQLHFLVAIVAFEYFILLFGGWRVEWRAKAGPGPHQRLL